ncbi:6-phosphofructokinase [Spinellus fusiger]|nr:6-phosphofructokinase [Spinellus fusiger]
MVELSHIILNASCQEGVENTVLFYTALGFEPVAEKENTTEEGVWLKLSTKDNSITLCVSNGGMALPPLPSLEGEAPYMANTMVLFIDSIKTVQTTLDALKTDYKQLSDVFLCAIDPLNNLVLLTLKRKSKTNKVLGAEPSRKIGVLTSGGDAAGMNAAVRAVVRYGISKGCEMYAIYEGYEGLVSGGDRIRRMDWQSVRGWLAVGGTTIGTARCMPFRTHEGRLRAAENLVQNGIDTLIVCGGDGSLTGADVFRSEWPDLIAELRQLNQISEQQATTYQHLTIVGMVGSIDNDMASTDITIGAITSLHRICESVDSIATTALSHSRAFVIEVMGRHCGWLALMAGIATGADFVFIPERPPMEDDWESTMCSVTHRHRQLGKRKTVIIVAEGAIDKSLHPIKAEYIKDILTERLGLDTRVTTLGHTQRGGSPAAFDRILATVQGVAAVDAALQSTPDTPSPLIGMSNNKVTCGPLIKAVQLTQEVAAAIGEKNFARAMELRDPQFEKEFNAYTASTTLDDTTASLPKHLRLRIGILHVGAPAGGMNAATRTAVRYALNRGHTPIAIYNGFLGLVRGSIEEMSWLGVDGWTSRGGSELGTNRCVPGEDVDLGTVACQLQKYNIQALMVIGGFEAFSALIHLDRARSHYPSLNIPIGLLPATISNNVPGTDYSLGSDTSLNAIVSACDAIIQSARSSRRRVFVVEVQGGNSGYLAVEAGLATGANTVYIPEEGISLKRLQSDVHHLIALYENDAVDKSEGRIVLRNEKASKTYTTDVISSILKDEGHLLFDSRTSVLGHIQQGNTPSPMDRIRATRLAMSCIEFIESHTMGLLKICHQQHLPIPIELSLEAASIAVVGLAGENIQISSVKDLLAVTDIKNRKPTKGWWYEHRDLIDVLSGRGLFSGAKE